MSIRQLPAKLLKWTVKGIFAVISLFFLLAIAIYLPPVQQWLKNYLCDYLSEETGMKVTIDRVRLSFPLDLLVDNMSAVEGQDTIVAARELLLDIKMLPLISGEVDLNGFELRQAQINSKSYISDTHIEGRFKLLAIDKPTVCNLNTKKIDVNKVRFRDADFRVILSDTAQQDTTPSEPVEWVIALNETDIDNTRFYLQLPGDSMRLSGDIKRLQMAKADINLKNEAYRIGELSLAAHDLSYSIPYEQETKGFDANHLFFNVFDTKLSDLSYDKQGLNVDLAHLALKEKSGLQLNNMKAKVHYDSTRVDLTDGYIKTPHSDIEAMVHLPFSALEENGYGSMEVKLKGSVGKPDVMIFAGDALGSFAKQYPDKPLEFNLRAEGTTRNVDIDYCHVTLPGCAQVRLSGNAHDITSELRRNGRLHYTVDLKDVNFIRGFIPSDLQKTIHIPNNLQLGGDVTFRGNNFNLSKNTLYCGKGSISFSGDFSASTMTYNGRLSAHQFPLQLFLPGMGLTPLTADFSINGRGTDILHNGTKILADGKISSFSYGGIPFNNIILKANIAGTNAEGTLSSNNSWLKGLLNFTAQQNGPELRASLNGNIDEFALNMGKPAKVVDGKTFDIRLIMNLNIKAYYNSQTKAMAIGGNIDPLNAITPTKGYPGRNVRFGIGTSPDSTHIYFNSGDMVAFLKSTDPLEHIISGFSNYADLFSRQITEAKINQDTLKTLLPNTHLRVRAGLVNPIQQILSMQGYKFDSIYAEIKTDPSEGINGRAFVSSFQTNNILLEKSELNIMQSTDGLKFNASVQNSQRRNPNRFSASIDGALLANGFSVLANFVDANGREGMNIGTRASFDGLGGMRFSLIPEISTIAYRKFKVNTGNFISIDSAGIMTADVNLLADDKTGLKLFSLPEDSTKQDITLSITHLNLRDLSNVIPFIPKMAGLVDGDIHVLKENNAFTAVGALETTDFEFEGTRLGTLGTELFYMPEEDGHYIVAQILKDNEEIAVLDGHYHDTGDGILDADLSLNHMPCSMLNPFLGDDGTLALKGDLDGEITVKGPTDKLAFNGNIMPDSVHVYSELYGFDMKMENKTVAIKDSKIKFDNISFYTIGENPLVINGDVDFGNFDDMLIDLSIKANNFEVINSKKTKKSMVYGNVFVDLDATLKGKAGFMVFRGSLKVLDKTNVTYVMTDTPLQVEDQFSNLVEFVDFSAPEDEQQEETKIDGTFINLAISVSERAHLHCELSPDAKSYVDCFGGGDLTFRMFPSGEMSVLGKFNINSGEMKYTLPFIPLKTFTFTEGNYIMFNGDVSNPTLNITAMENTKAAVTNEGGASRMVAFRVGVAITRQLSNMGLEFLIEAPEDTEVQSELATMSQEMRNKLAITMLATGMYVSNNNKAGFKANNALNSFLESEIQNIAGSALKTIDISVGVEGNTTSTGETQTDYTFQFAKKLWNDRISIIIGGKVTTGATEETSSSQSFIDNISFEYRIDNNSTRYIRVFYDNDTYEPLEGRYSSAGAGYIMRKKTNNLGELILFKRHKK